MRIFEIIIEFITDLFSLIFHRRQNELYEESMHIENMQMAQQERIIASKAKSSKEKRAEWLKYIAIPTVIENVKDTLKACEFFQKYLGEITESAESVYLEVAIVLDGESYTLEQIADSFDEALACSFGIGLDREYLYTLANYYYTNFYNDNVQKGIYLTSQEKRREYEEMKQKNN